MKAVLVFTLICLCAGCEEEKSAMPHLRRAIEGPPTPIESFAKGAGMMSPDERAMTLSQRVDSILHSKDVYPLWVKAGKIRVYVGKWYVTPARYTSEEIELSPILLDDDQQLTDRICKWLGFHYNQMTQARITP